MTEPRQRPHRSKQDYATQSLFIEAVLRRLKITRFAFDFAASATNTVAKKFWTEADDSLSKSPEIWRNQVSSDEWGWLNPPFTKIGPWALRCRQLRFRGGQVAFLVPAGVGSNWYRDHVHNHALVLALNGRLAFMPDKPTWLYPKDCILALYSPHLAPGFDVWRWRD